MKPGRDLDALIAEKVMGCRLKLKNGADWIVCSCEGAPHGRLEIKHYSTEIAAAWEVVEKVCSDKGMYHTLTNNRLLNHHSEFENLTYKGEPDAFGSDWQETAPHAICLAALNAVTASYDDWFCPKCKSHGEKIENGWRCRQCRIEFLSLAPQ